MREYGLCHDRWLIIKIIALIASAWFGVMVAGLILLVVSTLMTSGRLVREFLTMFFWGSAMGLPTMFLLFSVQLAKIIERWYREKNLRIHLSSWAIAIDAIAILVLLMVFASLGSPLISLWLFISMIQVPVVFRSQAIAEQLLTTYFPE